jgi:hypothetical protein
VARIATFVPDLLFGSKVLAAVTAAGHEPVVVAGAASLVSASADADGLIVDLTTDAGERVEAVQALDTKVPVLAFYSHVEADVRELALGAGFALVVPRSRMAREGAMLVTRLLATDTGGRSPGA